jgi:signal transduction histidine kinase
VASRPLPPAFLTGTRALQIAAVRWLLGVDLPDPRSTPDRETRLRCALWFAVHLVVGGTVGAALVVAVPLGLASLPRRHGVLLWPLAIVLLVAVGYAIAGLGALAATMALVLLGPSVGERVAALEARAVRLAERNRLARELHDSIGHALTVTTLQAAAARELLDADAAFVRRALESIEDTGRGAMEELDQLLGVLRDGEPPRRTPQPTLDDLDDLVDEARQAGARVSLTVRGALAQVPATVSREGYRIVQESITNALRHGGPVPVFVSLTVERDLLTIEAANASGSDGRGAGRGRGLAGMRERVVLLGGAMSVGPHDGRWRLQVRLPVQRRP